MEKRIFLFIALLLLTGSLVSAQDGGGLAVTTSPPGAEVTLRGEVIVSGLSPTTFRYGLSGSYQVEVTRHGYEKYVTRITLDPTRRFDLDIRLSPKTGMKAAARSLLLPGWGQKYSGQKTKGLLYPLAIMGAGIGYLIMDSDFKGKLDDFHDLEREYFAATDYSTQSRLYDQMALAQAAAFEAEDTRRILLGVGIGLWAWNVIDALVFFPENRESFSVKGLTLAPEFDEGRLGLTLSQKF